jgi:NitT/TauT family transport system substrate-binding protein
MVFKGTRIVTVFLAMLLFIAFLVSCGQRQTQGELKQINIAHFPNITHAQALLLKEQGTLEQAFEEDGVRINWITFNAGPSVIEALFAGAVDISYIGPMPALSGYIQSGGSLQIIAGASNGGTVLVARNDSGISTARDLDGKTVAVPQFGNTQHLSLLALLTENGLRPSTHGGSVTVVQSSNADIANLMDRGNIDAALVPEPWGSILELNRNGQIVLDYNQVDSYGVPATAIVIVRKDFLEAHPDAVEIFIEAHKGATLYINNNVDISIDIINKQIAETTQSMIDKEVLESAFGRLQISYEIPYTSIMNFAQLGVDENLLARLPDDGLTNESFLR